MNTSETKTELSRKEWDNSSTCLATDAEGRDAGLVYGCAESKSNTLARILARQARAHFGNEDPEGRRLLDRLARGFVVEGLEELGARLFNSSNWSEWLAGVETPPPAPVYPDYARKLEMDLTPTGPSIDAHAIMTAWDGKKQLFHMRFQKWYQPELDRVLFEESLRLERQHGMKVITGVILMLPSADGPDMTGEYSGIDWKGNPRRFSYRLLRAWEMPLEQSLATPATAMLAPLGKGAKERMAEIVEHCGKILDQPSVELKIRNLAWPLIYWNMGLVCSLEEAHGFLSERMGFIRATPEFRKAVGHAFQEGHYEATKDGPLEATRSLVVRQASQRFGEAGSQDFMRSASTLEDFEALAGRLASNRHDESK